MPDLYYSERNLLQAAAEGKQITEAEIRVLTDRLERLRDRNRKLRAAIAAIRVNIIPLIQGMRYGLACEARRPRGLDLVAQQPGLESLLPWLRCAFLRRPQNRWNAG